MKNPDSQTDDPALHKKPRPAPELDQPKTDEERIRTQGPGPSTQPEDAAVDENVRRGAPRHDG